MPADSAPAATRSWWPLATAGVIFLLISFHQIAQPDLAGLQDPLARTTLIVLSIAVVALGLVQALRSLSTDLRETLFLVVAAGIAFWLALVETAFPIGADRPVLGFSAVGPWIVVICLAVRARTPKTMIAAFAMATMWPLAYAINAQRLALPPAPWSRLIVWPALNYAMAALACLLRRSIAAESAGREAVDGLGSYRLLAPIGSGGMGEVWSATHQLLARQAAIKLVKPRQTPTSPRQLDEWVRRFQREANTIAGLQSPHTIYLYDFGVARDGQFYYVMELLDGISLETLVKTFGPQPAPRVRHIMRQICESLEEAHQRNLVHRDLKPSNVMLCKIALRHDFVKVLDFGLAKCAACEEVTQITVENVAAGTPGYISPEVALGEEKIDGRADLYALGCVGYYLLTGALVFEDANPMSMVVKHVQTEPVPPSQRTDRPVPADLERLILKCLEKSPASRPPSARQVAAMLDACDIPAWTEHDAAMWWEQQLPDTSALRTTPTPPPSAQTTHTAVGVRS